MRLRPSGALACVSGQLGTRRCVLALTMWVAALALLRVPAQSGPTGGLQQMNDLLTAEQSALDSGDSAAILTAGRQLAAFASRTLGDLYAAEGKPAAAAAAYRDSMAVLPNAGTLLQLASLRHSEDDLPGTIAALTEASALQPDAAPVHLALGTAFWELNEYSYNADSLREFSAAQRLSPEDPVGNANLGAILSQYQRYDEAAVYLRAAAAADPASPDPWLQLGMNAYAQQRFAEAEAALNKAVALTGTGLARNDFQIRRAFAVLNRLAIASGHEAEAQRYAMLTEQAHTAMLQAKVAAPLSESTGLVSSTVTGPARAAAPPTAAAASITTPEQQQIEAQLKGIIAKSLNDAGTALARNRDYAGALPLFRQASLADPTLLPVMRNLGLAAFHTGAYAEAIAALTRALAQTPDDAGARKYLQQSQSLLESTPGHTEP